MIENPLYHTEPKQPMIYTYCEYCGKAIWEHEEYYDHDGIPLHKDQCAKKYSWEYFQAEAELKRAGE